MDALTTRNFEAMSQGLKDMRSELVESKMEGKRKDAKISQLEQRLLQVEQRMAILFAKSMGHGATQ